MCMPLRRTRPQRHPSLVPQPSNNIARLRRSQTLLPQRQCTRMDLCLQSSREDRGRGKRAARFQCVTGQECPGARKRAGQLVFMQTN